MVEVIGAGFGRTGTYSLKLALEILGYSPCYHMFDLIRQPEDYVSWSTIHESPDAVSHLLADHRAIVDFPGCLHVAALLERYPSAKCILTHRTPEDWYLSAKKTILHPLQSFEYMLTRGIRVPFSRRERERLRMFIYVKKRLANAIFRGKKTSKENALLGYDQHIQTITDIVPDAQLLHYEIGQGWGPLCDFLGCDIPPVPFPRTNQRSHFKELMRAQFK